MGQRFQSVFILPKVFMNEGNTNNRSEKVLIFHNQWLYGRGALNVNLGIMERIHKAILLRDKCGGFAETKEDFINHFLEKSVLNAVSFVSLQELHNETHFHKPEELIYSEEEKKPKEEQITLKELIRRQDNNNGFFICKIDELLNISYAFISGFEDEFLISQKTPKEYLKLFYSDEDLKKTKGLYEHMKTQIKKFNNFDVIKDVWLEDTIKYLNENKPSWAN